MLALFDRLDAAKAVYAKQALEHRSQAPNIVGTGPALEPKNKNRPTMGGCGRK
jgi:hypothetical protein